MRQPPLNSTNTNNNFVHTFAHTNIRPSYSSMSPQLRYRSPPISPPINAIHIYSRSPYINNPSGYTQNSLINLSPPATIIKQPIDQYTNLNQYPSTVPI